MRPKSRLRAGRGVALLLVLSMWASGVRAENLDVVLNRTSRQVSAFLEQFSDVKCTERVSQAKLNKGGHAEYNENSTFDYFVLLQGSDDDLLLNESRLQEKGERKPAKNIPLLITNGFSTMFLVFHPYYRNGFRFEADGEEVAGGQQLMRVRFVHIPGTRTLAALAVRGREYPLELSGVAWLDADTGEVVRIETGLSNDMRDVGLRSLTSTVEYAPVRLPGWSRAYRFPVSATVDVETLRQHWRNVHEFNNYQRFMVDTEQSVADTTVKNEKPVKRK